MFYVDPRFAKDRRDMADHLGHIFMNETHAYLGFLGDIQIREVDRIFNNSVFQEIF
ncbi:hypothetical protein SDC9_189162 [bioreactor metagenome]|uniref:Uncharacterized protein n=1 Tax=bioreactor metagenome TaxID=1076179 RepID=A0A645HRD4_9ZZZZ